MKSGQHRSNLTGLFVLGSLYPHVTGGMEIFNYYFLKNCLGDAAMNIYYLGYEKADSENGNFVHLRKLWPARMFYPVQFFIAILQLRKKIKFAYISYAEQSWIISFTQSLTLKIFGIPYFVTNHWGKAPDWKFRFPIVYFFRNAKAVIGVSEPICLAFKRTLPDREFKYIPPLIPFKRAVTEKQILKAQFGFLDRERILLFVGTLKPMKNPEKIVEAFRILGPEFLEALHIRLVFAGAGEMSNELRERVKEFDLGDYIRFEGLVSREKIPEYYKISDFYIIASDYEGTSLSLLEAMFNEMAIIASDAPGINKMLQHEESALLYQTKNTPELAETLKRIFTDQNLACRLAKRACSDFRLQYSYESMIDQYKAMFYTAG